MKNTTKLSLLLCNCLLAHMGFGQEAKPAGPATFKPEMESLREYRCPDWFRDAKFGIWSHWGPQAVPEGGDWYARFMYVQGTGAYNLHLKKFGHPSKVGYKDVVAQWKAEKFDKEQADRLIKLYKAAGARYFVSMGVHHDNFDLWNSKHHKWNAVNMGPKKDIVGMWAEAARNNGLRFGVSEHLERAYSWFNTNKGSDKTGPLAGVPYDGNNPAYADFYFPPHDDTRAVYPKNPPESWTHQWRDRINDLVESYRPDFLYSDGGIPFGEVGRSVIANFYNKNIEWHDGKLEAVYALKNIGKDHGDYVHGVGVLDMERGVRPKIEELPWQTDTSIGDWFYNPGWKYRPASWTIHMLVDIVSKNGNLLLNVVQRADGTIDPEAEQMLKDMAAWMDVHGEAIFGTRPWLVYGEGKIKVKEGGFNENNTYDAREIRFTTKGPILYAIALGWPKDGKLVVRSLANGAGAISRVSLLGYDGKVDWKQTDEGLVVSLPAQKVSAVTAGLKIVGENLEPVSVADIIKPDSGGNYALEASKSKLHGDKIRVATLEGKNSLAFWDKASDWASWKVNFDKPGTYDIALDLATPNNGVEFALDVAGQTVAGTALRTGDYMKFQVCAAGKVQVEKTGVQTISIRAKNPATWKPINLREIRLSPSKFEPMAPAPIPPEIENEQIQGINRQPWHATLMPYGSLPEALAAKRHESSFCRSLNGMWKFHWVPRPEERPVDFYKPEFDVATWKEIPVPSNWQVVGYGTPFYRNGGYTFQKDPPRVMTEPPKNYTAFKERNPVGSYRRDFLVPPEWKGRQIFISFDGVDAGFFLWVNGQKVGYSINSRNVAEFDLTPYLTIGGTNVLAAEVYQYTAGSYFEDQDMWRLSGIFRNVTLWSSPRVHIRDFAVVQQLDDNYMDAELSVSAKVRNFGDQPAPGRNISLQLYDAAGKPVSGAAAEEKIPPLNPGEEKIITLKTRVSGPAHWTAETPNLYTTVLSMDGDPEFLSARTGFRKIEIKGRVFTVNGVPIKLKGANRHEHWADTGHVVSEERMIRDLAMLKQANCNHVRTSHYTNDPRWYELCDEWGIYLVAEANVECHGLAGKLDRDPRWETMIVDRNIANVENLKNHPSVLIWSLGNECGGGSNVSSALKAVEALDPTRPTHYQHFGIGKGNPARIDSRMYGSVAEIEENARDDSKFSKPFYMCEYAHAMNNSMGSLDAFNEVFDKYPAALGGAIWEWQDQGLWNRRDPKRQFLAYGGGFGEFPNDGYFIHKGVVFSDRSPKPHFPEVEKVYQWIGLKAEDLAAGKIRVRNKYAFTSLDRFDGSWTVSEDGQVIQQGKLDRLDLAPLAETTVKIPFKEITAKPGADYYLRLSFTLSSDERWAKAGYEVASEQFKLPVSAPAKPVPDLKPLKLRKDERTFNVVGQGFEITFDKAEGTLSAIQVDGRNLLLPGGGPKLYLWRAPHRYDDWWAREDWNRCGLYQMSFKTLSCEAEQVQPSLVRVRAVIEAKGKSNFSMTHTVVYGVFGDGSVVVDNSLAPQGPRIPLARLGVRLLLDRGLEQFTYLGRGPMENYADRKSGSDVGLYRTTVRENLTPYSRPMECGNHEDVRWAALTGKDGSGLMAQADRELLQISALPYTDEVLDKTEYSVDLPESSASVLTVATRTLGVGSKSCGPRPLDQFIVWSDPAAFSYVLRIVPAGKADLSGMGWQTVSYPVALRAGSDENWGGLQVFNATLKRNK